MKAKYTLVERLTVEAEPPHKVEEAVPQYALLNREKGAKVNEAMKVCWRNDAKGINHPPGFGTLDEVTQSKKKLVGIHGHNTDYFIVQVIG